MVFRFKKQLLFLRARGKLTKAVKIRMGPYYSYLSKRQIINGKLSSVNYGM